MYLVIFVCNGNYNDILILKLIKKINNNLRVK